MVLGSFSDQMVRAIKLICSKLEGEIFYKELAVLAAVRLIANAVSE